MDYINAILFGTTQGITEFLPISSSGHLVVLHKFISLPIKNELVFDVVLHLATLLAVVLFFKKDILLLFNSWLKSLAGKPDKLSKISWLIILATLPAALAGWFLEDIIESSLRSPFVVAIMLIIVGALLIVFEKISRKIGEMESLTWPKALIIGLAQAVALIPGTSRSGITIIAGLAMNLKRQAAVRFSFLLSILIIFGASIKTFPQLFHNNLAGDEIGILAVAFIASFISGFYAIKYFLRFVEKRSLAVFAYYRFILAILIIALFYINK